MQSEVNIPRLLEQIGQACQKMMAERNLEKPVIVGIRTGGVWLAQELRKRLNLNTEVGELDIAFYRDDFTRIGLNPRVQPSHLPFETEDKDILLVDDVIMSGRTIRAAMNELFDYGRPASITLITLIDIGGRELPIQPDIVGKRLTLQPNEQIKLNGPEPLSLEIRKK